MNNTSRRSFWLSACFWIFALLLIFSFALFPLAFLGRTVSFATEIPSDSGAYTFSNVLRYTSSTTGSADSDDGLYSSYFSFFNPVVCETGTFSTGHTNYNTFFGFTTSSTYDSFRFNGPFSSFVRALFSSSSANSVWSDSRGELYLGSNCGLYPSNPSSSTLLYWCATRVTSSTTKFTTVYPSSLRSGDTLTGYDSVSSSSTPGLSSSATYYMNANSGFLSAFTPGHEYSILLYAVVPGAAFSYVPVFHEENLLCGTIPGTDEYLLFNTESSSYFGWQRPSFVPTYSTPGDPVDFDFCITPQSFYDSTLGEYVYPIPSIEPSPPSPPGYDEGYQAGYSDGYNKGQSEQLVNPASFFLTPVQTFLSTPLFGTFSLGDAFSVVMFVLVAVIFVKLFAGG